MEQEKKVSSFCMLVEKLVVVVPSLLDWVNDLLFLYLSPKLLLVVTLVLV